MERNIYFNLWLKTVNELMENIAECAECYYFHEFDTDLSNRYYGKLVAYDNALSTLTGKPVFIDHYDNKLIVSLLNMPYTYTLELD